MAEPLVVIENLHKSFVHLGRRLDVLRGIDLVINQGEIVAIVGPSGSGKSTLMNLLGCLDTPTDGRYLLDGVEVQILDDDALAEIRNRKIVLSFKASTCCRGQVPSTMWRCRCCTREQAGRHDGKLRSRRCVASDWATGCTTGPISSRVDSDSGWRLPVRSSTIRRCFWRTSRREILISGPGRKSSHCLKDCTKKA